MTNGRDFEFLCSEAYLGRGSSYLHHLRYIGRIGAQNLPNGQNPLAVKYIKAQMYTRAEIFYPILWQNCEKWCFSDSVYGIVAFNR